MLCVLGVSVMTPRRGQLGDPQMLLKGAGISSPYSKETSQGMSALLRGYLLQLYKQLCALMSTIYWARVTGFKIIVCRGSHNWYRNTGLIGCGGECI